MVQPGRRRDHWLGADQLSFRPAFHCEDALGVAVDDNHSVFKWSGGQVFFSCCQKGDALSAHFSTDRKGIRLLRQAIEEFCTWAFDVMPWCRMIFACIVRPSVVRLVVKCGFSYLVEREGAQIYVRFQKWEAS